MPDHPGPDRVFEGSFDLGSLNLLTVAEVARALRTSKMTVYRLIRSGELVATRVGRGLRIPSQCVRDYLAATAVSQQADPPSAPPR